MGNLRAMLAATPYSYYTVSGFGPFRIARVHQYFGWGSRAGIYAGINRSAQAQLKHALVQTENEMARKYLDKDTQSQLQQIQSQSDDLRKEQTVSFRRVGISDFTIPESAFTDEEDIVGFWKQARDYRTLIQILSAKYRAEAGTGKEFPFRKLEIAWLRAAMPNVDAKRRSEEMFDIAKECVATANMVPSDEFYARQRGEILQFASNLAMQAVVLDMTGKSWAKAYNPKAAYASWWLELAEKYNSMDIAGDRREQLFSALTLSGQREEALQLGLELKDLRAQSPLYHYHLACLYATQQGKYKEAMQSLEEAVQTGFKDLNGARKNPDFANYHTDPRFKGLTGIVVEYRMVGEPAALTKTARPVPKGPAISNGVTFTNRSPFPLTNVRLRLEVTSGKGPAITHRCDRDIAAGESYLWANAIPDNRLVYRVILECDQGRDKYP